jgi:hypothetical protein
MVFRACAYRAASWVAAAMRASAASVSASMVNDQHGTNAEKLRNRRLHSSDVAHLGSQIRII